MGCEQSKPAPAKKKKASGNGGARKKERRNREEPQLSEVLAPKAHRRSTEGATPRTQPAEALPALTLTKAADDDDDEELSSINTASTEHPVTTPHNGNPLSGVDENAPDENEESHESCRGAGKKKKNKDGKDKKGKKHKKRHQKTAHQEDFLLGSAKPKAAPVMKLGAAKLERVGAWIDFSDNGQSPLGALLDPEDYHGQALRATEKERLVDSGVPMFAQASSMPLVRRRTRIVQPRRVSGNLLEFKPTDITVQHVPSPFGGFLDDMNQDDDDNGGGSMMPRNDIEVHSQQDMEDLLCLF
jgi:hypothetical protein